MLQAELMIHHNVVVLHAQRLHNDLETILKQIALSCFQFQLLTQVIL